MGDFQTSFRDSVDLFFFCMEPPGVPICSDNMFCFFSILTRLYDANKYKNV